ncbi:MAG TPA: pyridoxamine 5'-phosphate oxidase family protein [Acidimicrobiia bacterium]|nr:pyridoxamine 5'-phosphate oxidase family protein [Acidimicrobiia bacterium]
MATWSEVEQAVPELAEAVRAAFDAHKHKVLATLRADGSPRLSGSEATFRDGDVWLGMMHLSRKALDLRRDARMELHSAPADEELKLGDARLAGRAVEITDPDMLRSFAGGDSAGAGENAELPEPYHLFRVDVTDITLIRIGDPADHLVIESWSGEAGYKRIERR